MTRLSEDFLLGEFLPHGESEMVPQDIVSNLRIVVAVLLQPMRDALGWPVLITSGYRPDEYNDAVGGVRGSDHGRGCAADFQLRPVGDNPPWEDATMQAWKWLSAHCAGRFGQLIWCDHRRVLNNPGKLWVHVSLVSTKHPGTPQDRNRLLFTFQPKQYHEASEELFG